MNFKKNITFLTILVILSVASATIFVFNNSNTETTTYPGISEEFIRNKISFSSDLPITISSNSQFTTYATSGNGSMSNPFIIENYFINNTQNGNGNGVEITNTNSYFIMRNVTVSKSSVNGFYINNIVNGVFKNNTASNISHGFYIENSQNNTFETI